MSSWKKLSFVVIAFALAAVIGSFGKALAQSINFNFGNGNLNIGANVNFDQNPPPQVNYFYNSLAPYGTWVNMEGYGWCWQPGVEAANPNWMPYSDGGGWVYSDAGWYWNSSYEWGWAPFHYGRWWRAPAGWVWFPDTVWAPSWVSWRTGDQYCGWAPLPPNTFPAQVGFAANFHFGLDVNVNLGAADFCFVPFGNIFNPDPVRYRASPTVVQNVFVHTTVINNFSSGAGGIVQNRGIPLDRVKQYVHQPIQVARVENSTVNPNDRRPGLSRSGSTMAIYRPQLVEQKPTGPIRAERVKPNQKIVQRPAPATQKPEQRAGQPVPRPYAPAGAQPNEERKAQPNVTQPRNEARPQPQVQPRNEQRPEVTQPRPEAKPEVKEPSGTERRVEPREQPQAQPRPQARPEARPEVKEPSAAQVQPRPEERRSQPQATQPRTETRPEVREPAGAQTPARVAPEKQVPPAARPVAPEEKKRPEQP
jgi:hypothetical protein